MATNTNVIKFPQRRLAGGFTQIPNDLLAACISPTFRGSKAAVLLAVARLTLGWGVDKAKIKLSDIAEMAKMSKSRVSEVLKELEAMGALDVVYTRTGRMIGIIDDYAALCSENPKPETRTVSENPNLEVRESRTLSKYSTKYIKNPPIVPQTPEEALTGPADADASAACVSADAEANQPAKPKTSAARFAEFWAAYPRKVGKAPSLAKWKAKRLDALADRILADIAERSRRDRKWLEGYIPNPLTYLTQERWEDEIEAPRAQVKPQQHAEPVRRRRELGV